MAEFDYQRALEKAFQPLNTLGGGRVAIAEAELRHRRKLEEAAVERSFRVSQARTYRDSALELQKQGDLNAIEREKRMAAEGLVVENRKRAQKDEDELADLYAATGFEGDVKNKEHRKKAYEAGVKNLGGLLDQRDAADEKVLKAMKVDYAKVELDAKEAFLNDPGSGLDPKAKQALRNIIHDTPAFTALLAKKEPTVIESYGKILKDHKATAIENGRNDASLLARAALSRYDSLNMEIAKLQRVLPAGVTAKAFLQRGEAPPPPGLPGTYDHTGTLIAGGGDDAAGLRIPPKVNPDGTTKDDVPPGGQAAEPRIDPSVYPASIRPGLERAAKAQEARLAAREQAIEKKAAYARDQASSPWNEKVAELDKQIADVNEARSRGDLSPTDYFKISQKLHADWSNARSMLALRPGSGLDAPLNQRSTPQVESYRGLPQKMFLDPDQDSDYAEEGALSFPARIENSPRPQMSGPPQTPPIPQGSGQFQAAGIREKVMAIIGGADEPTMMRAAQMFSQDKGVPPDQGQQEFSNILAVASQNPNGEETNLIRSYIQKAQGGSGGFAASPQPQPVFQQQAPNPFGMQRGMLPDR